MWKNGNFLWLKPFIENCMNNVLIAYCMLVLSVFHQLFISCIIVWFSQMNVGIHLLVFFTFDLPYFTGSLQILLFNVTVIVLVFFFFSKEFVLVIYMILGLCPYVPSNIIFSIITKKSRFVIRKSTGAGSAVHPVPSINMYVCHVQC